MTESEVLASVLVVDDTVENLRLLANVLGDQGYEVRPVTNGRQAIQAAENDPPDLILLDINMPDMNGYEVCRRLKASARVRDVPVIFLTALTDTADKVRAFDAGGVDYVTKPFQFEEVLARVRTHVTLRRAQSALSDSYDRLRVLEKMRDDLVHMIVHDMRSPLTGLIGNLTLLEQGTSSALDASCAEDLRDAIEAAEMLNRMANDLLDVNRLEEGKMPIERTTCDLARIAADVRSLLSGMDPGHHIDVESEAVVEATCDGAIVRRVLENLVSNGIKHTPSGGRLRISVARTDTRVRVAVQDEGRGVPPEARDQIFEKFGTLQARKDRVYHSAGLGLTFCKLAVEAHGGAIGVDAAVPAGSVFWFELPQ